MPVSVADPSGRTWQVSRRLFRMSRPPGFGRPRLDATDGVVASSGSGGIGDLVLGLVIVAMLVLAVAFVWPLILFALELLLAGVAVGARALLGRWTVVAETRGSSMSWAVRGRKRSNELLERVTASLRDGREPPPGGRFQGQPWLQGLTEADIVRRETSGHVRVRVLDRDG